MPLICVMDLSLLSRSVRELGPHGFEHLRLDAILGTAGCALHAEEIVERRYHDTVVVELPLDGTGGQIGEPRRTGWNSEAIQASCCSRERKVVAGAQRAH